MSNEQVKQKLWSIEEGNKWLLSAFPQEWRDMLKITTERIEAGFGYDEKFLRVLPETEAPYYGLDCIIKRSFTVQPNNKYGRTFYMSPVPNYCGAYVVDNIGGLTGIDEYFAVTVLRHLYHNGTKGDPKKNHYLIQNFQPKFILFDTEKGSGLKFLKHYSQRIPLGVNNNSGNLTAMWIVGGDSLDKAHAHLTKSYCTPPEEVKEKSDDDLYTEMTLNVEESR